MTSQNPDGVMVRIQLRIPPRMPARNGGLMSRIVWRLTGARNSNNDSHSKDQHLVSMQLCLLTLLSFAPINAVPGFETEVETQTVQATESIAGKYRLKNSPLDAEMEIIRLPWPFTECFIGKISLNGEVVDGETMLICPAPDGGFTWTNRKGNKGTLKRQDDGDLESVVTTGPNEGHTTGWEKL